MSLESFVEEIPEAYYRKAIDLNRYSNSVARKLMQSYERIIRRSIAELERIEQMPSAKRPQVRAQRLKALIKQNTEALARWSDKAGQQLARELGDLAKIEVDFTVGQLRRGVPEVARGAVRTVEVTPTFAEAVITADPTNVGTAVLSDSLEEIVSGPAKAMKLTARQGAAIRMPDGRSIGKAFRGLAEQQAQIFATTVQDGLLSGESTQAIARTLIGEGLEFSTKAKSIRQLAQAGGQMTKMATHQVRTLVRTSVNATSNVASQRVYRANPTVTKRYRWLATLDEKTSPICKSLDQQVFEYGKGPTPASPPHFNCRSTTVPVVDWDGLSSKYGIDLTPPKSKAKRPSATGGVPLGTSYGKWLHDQRPAGKKFEASAAQAKAFGGGKDTPGARLKAKYFNRLADKYGPDKAMKKFLREDGTEVSIADLQRRYGDPEKITTTKVKAKPKALTKNEKIAKQVMQDPSLKSDKKRIEAMVEKGVPANSDFVGLVAEAKKKSGLATTETFPKAKPKPAAAPKVSLADRVLAPGPQNQLVFAKQGGTAKMFEDSFSLLEEVDGEVGANARKMRRFIEKQNVVLHPSIPEKFSNADRFKGNQALLEAQRKAVEALEKQGNNPGALSGAKSILKALEDGNYGELKHVMGKAGGAAGYTTRSSGIINAAMTPNSTTLNSKRVKRLVASAEDSLKQQNAYIDYYKDYKAGTVAPKPSWNASGLGSGGALDPDQWLSTTIHEVGHQVHFRGLAGTKLANKYKGLGGEKFVSQYAHSNEFEQFAEAFVHYVLNPKGLKASHPRLYQWVDDAMEEALK